MCRARMRRARESIHPSAATLSAKTGTKARKTRGMPRSEFHAGTARGGPRSQSEMPTSHTSTQCMPMARTSHAASTLLSRCPVART
ncbi:MAG: hypothetical protein R3A52_10825 [Polyangiales bacterium]